MQVHKNVLESTWPRCGCHQVGLVWRIRMRDASFESGVT